MRGPARHFTWPAGPSSVCCHTPPSTCLLVSWRSVIGGAAGSAACSSSFPSAPLCSARARRCVASVGRRSCATRRTERSAPSGRTCARSQWRATAARSSQTARSVSPPTSRALSARMAATTGVESVRCRPPAVSQPCCSHSCTSASTSRFSAGPCSHALAHRVGSWSLGQSVHQRQERHPRPRPAGWCPLTAAGGERPKLLSLQEAAQPRAGASPA